VVGLTNWRSAPATRRLNFAEKLGLEGGREYVVFDFWKQELLGTFRDSLTVEVGAHDTRVLAIHPRFDRPQAIGNSRHISGAYSIDELSWDAGEKKLRGTLEVVAGAPYTLFIHVPPGYKQVAARASAGTVSMKEGSRPGMLVAGFQGQKGAVKWEIEFAK